ncbi:putative oxidoreductase [Dioscorea sansibarensis]
MEIPWRSLVFAINGERFELSDIDPSTTLLEFLRTETRYKGAKLGCGEGGCGACVVLLSTYDPTCRQVKQFSVSSCLTLICSIHLCSVTTVEGLGNCKDGFHAIQKRFAGFHASQCGFCTPGMCMSLCAALANADKSQRPEPPNGFSKITLAEAEKAIAGNLCRCTGYRPIIDVCKSFAADVDLEDLGLNSFWKKGDKDVNVNMLPFYDQTQNGLGTFPDFLKSEIESSMYSYSRSLVANGSNSSIPAVDVLNPIENVSLAQGRWYRPSSINELRKLMVSERMNGTSNVKLVVGNTGSGYYKEEDLFDKYIDIRGIPELSVVKRNNRGIEIGAAVTISRVIEVLREESEGLQLNERLVFSKIADHMNKVASQFVRNTASLGGNLIMAQRSQFPSDIATILLAAGSTVCIDVTSQRLTISLEEFFGRPPCENMALLLSVHIPLQGSFSESLSGMNDVTDFTSNTECNLLFETFRASPRPLGNALAYVNSAFLAWISLNDVSGYPRVESVRLAFGAFGSEHPFRAHNVEKFLVGKTVTAFILLEAIKLLRETIIPKDCTPHSDYRLSLAVGFLFKFLQPFAKDLTDPLKMVTDIDIVSSAEDLNDVPSSFSNSSYDKTVVVKDAYQVDHHSSLFSSKQVTVSSGDYCPVGQPIRKAGAKVQASGEAVFVDDLPSPKYCLYGSFIYSTKPLAQIKGIEFKSTLTSKKIIAVISHKDIPSGGENIGSMTMFGDEPLFANGIAEYAGQPLGVVIAEKQRFANMAAKQAIINYSTENLEPPILSIEDAIKRSSFFDVPPFLYPKQVGDFSKGMEEADHRILSQEICLGSQYYFYLETQTALAVPDEDNCMLVYSSTQSPETAQAVIAKCLGIPFHNVRVITRRVGGGFGGKATRSLRVAAACALAAHKLHRPIRMYLDRKTDMVLAGGRHPMKVTYSVGFKSSGKITALHVDLVINAGISVDVSPILPHNIIGSLKKYNWGALSFTAKVCKTNISTKSAMRGPGEVQGSFIAEAIIEHVASSLSVHANLVRKVNLHNLESLRMFHEGCGGEASEYTLPYIFDKFTAYAGYNNHVEMIQQLNSCNKWRKRGLSCVPVIQPVILRPTPGKVGILNDGSIIVEVGGIEVGQGLWTKVKQMAAFALGQLWEDGSQDLLERVRVIQADTLSLIQGGWTAGSTTSESSCEAVRLACNILVDRLKFLKNSLQDEAGSVSWDTLILQATVQAINLSASTYFVPDLRSQAYLNYGAALSEVEVDLLTGATTVLRTDLCYDCGKSLNPAVDLGQIEGAFVQGIGFFMYEEYLANSEGLNVTDGTWTYKIPTVDTIPKQFNVELLNSGHHEERVLSSKASGEPPLLLAASVHCATRQAIKAAREEYRSAIPTPSPDIFQLDVPATMPVVKELCGFDIVERYLQNSISIHQPKQA